MISNETVALSGMTKKQLMQYAEDNGIPDVSLAQTKAQMIETIEAQ